MCDVKRAYIQKVTSKTDGFSVTR